MKRFPQYLALLSAVALLVWMAVIISHIDFIPSWKIVQIGLVVLSLLLCLRLLFLFLKGFWFSVSKKKGRLCALLATAILGACLGTTFYFEGIFASADIGQFLNFHTYRYSKRLDYPDKKVTLYIFRDDFFLLSRSTTSVIKIRDERWPVMHEITDLHPSAPPEKLTLDRMGDAVAVRSENELYVFDLNKRHGVPPV